jgi:glycosyltransferase involved in cell wall biosynthesis
MTRLGPASRPHPVLIVHQTDVMAGGERSLLNLMRHLDPRKFLAHITCEAGDEFVTAARNSGISVARQCFPRLRPPGAAAWRALRRLVTHCRDTRTTLLHANTPRTNLYAALAGRIAGIPVIWHCRNLLEGRMLDIDRRFAWMPDRIICNSAAIAARFAGSPWAGRVVTIVNGIDLTEFHPSIPGECIRSELGWHGRPVIAATSRLDPEKGHEILLEAMRTVLASRPDAKLLIAGRAAVDPDGRHAAVQRQIETLGLTDSVRLLGFRRDIPHILAAADVCVLPATAEACGRVLLEAMAMGKPIVGTASGGTPEIVVDGVTGDLVTPGNPSALATALLAMLQDPCRARRMGASGRKHVAARYTIEEHVRKTMQVYTGVLVARGVDNSGEWLRDTP